jgi:hypothetical protein
VDQLIPWLLDEDQQLRGVPFSELIFDATGRNVLRLRRRMWWINASRAMRR